MRSRFTRFRDRASYKPSEVLGLFVISLFFGMFVFLIMMAVDHMLTRFFG